MYIHYLIYSFILQSNVNLNTNHEKCPMTKRFFIKDPEVVELSGVVIQSFYKDVTMFVFRGNGAEPMLCVPL